MSDAIDTSRPLSYVQGDRFCAECGSNLHGQPVFREERYQMLITRCPQCDRVEPVEAYPPLGRWTTRWSMLLTALWLVGLFMFAFAGLAFVTGTTFGFTSDATNRYQSFIRDEFQGWLTEQEAGSWYETQNRERFAEFWQLNGEQVRADAGSFPSLIKSGAMTALLVPMSVSLALGMVWSVALLHQRRTTLIRVFGLLMLAPASVYVVAWIVVGAGDIQSTDQVHFLDRIFPIATIVACMNVGLFWVGIYFGRSVARSIVRGLLAPRRRGALSMLWTVDGLTPPRFDDCAGS